MKLNISDFAPGSPRIYSWEDVTDVIWLVLINVLILGGALYACLRLRTGYLPFEETVEDIQRWLKHHKEKKKQ